MTIFTRKRSLGAIAIMGLSALALTACGSAPAPGASGSAGASDFLACAVSDEGSWNDKSFNEAAYGGLKKAESDLGVKITGLESHSTEDFQPNLEKTVSQNCDVTFAVGFNFSENDVMFNAAKANPTHNFVWIDGWNADPALANLKPIQYDMAQSSFLAGYLAAAYSTSKVVGTYGGMQIDAVTVFMDGFYNGAKYYEKQKGTPVTVVGWNPATKTGDFVGDFANTGVAKQLSQGQLTKGADVIFPVAGGLFTATAEAINEGGKGVLIGVDKDIATTQPDLAPITLTSVEKRMTTAVFDVIKSLKDGEKFTDEAYVGTLANDGTALSAFGAFDSKVSADTKSELETITKDIESGTIDPKVTP
ncbi:BMP family ABC transporter substrate-binding protein [uncultured Microbacterium sp.]|uniref:BMP family lipoprotein n=1 Tax=uncultured Microbacterium sp. TaxID=191216 RepID=UPI0025E8993E|nr:BMP family ABC transporter substrate-binding protein [uncultured Microbacterium sp.]